MNEPSFDPRVVEFCERLDQLGPGERARLKRNAGRALAESRNVMGLFFRLLPRNVPRYQEETYFLVATLFPLARKDGEGNLGHALYHARDPKYAQGLDRRVEVLLDADREQLPFRLRQASFSTKTFETRRSLCFVLYTTAADRLQCPFRRMGQKCASVSDDKAR